MINLLTALSIASKLFSSSSRHSKEVKEVSAFAGLLADKYQLPAVKEVGRFGSQYGGGYSYEICSQEWENQLAEVVKQVLAADHVNDAVMELCGDLALFIVVLRYKRKRDEGPCYGEASPYEYLRPLQTTETWQSLLEMGRGRGGDYSLKLIKTEFQNWLGSLSFNLLARGGSKT
jgi:hypothetical protein